MGQQNSKFAKKNDIMEDRQIAKLEEEKQELKERMAKKEEENRGLKEQMTKTEEENRGLKERMAKKEAYIKELTSSIRRRPMPAELKYEMFDSMPLENAFALLANMSSGLLARNVRNRINGTRKAMKNNKWNVNDCGPLLAISEDGLVLMYIGTNFTWYNSVRAVSSIPSFMKGIIKKPTITFYFEVRILDNTRRCCGIGIGLSDQQLPLENNWLGQSNSIGIWQKDAIWIDGSPIKFGNDDGHLTKGGNVIGLGIIHQSNAKVDCFFTCNGTLLGKTKLPRKYANIDLYPAVTLTEHGQSIRANFGKEEWAVQGLRTCSRMNNWPNDGNGKKNKNR